MQSEDEQNWTVLRKILALCDEGANDEMSDGSDGAEPSTAADRQRSRRPADWLRTTLYPYPNSMRRHATGEEFFSDDDLWKELEHEDEERQDAASDALDSLAALASVRARKRGTSFILERQVIFDVGLITVDIQGADAELRAAAHEAFEDVFHLRGLVDIAEAVSTPEEDAVVKKLYASVRAQVDALMRELEEREKAGGS